MLFCLVYVIYVCLTIVVSNTYCVVFVGFFFVLCALFAIFSGLSFLDFPIGFSLTFICYGFWSCFGNLDWFVLDLSGAVFSTRTVVVAAPILLVETRWVIMQCIIVSMCPAVGRSMLSCTFFILQRLFFKLVSMNLLHYCYFISFSIMM